MTKRPPATQALLGIYRYYEKGLDTAGYTSSALMFETWGAELENGNVSIVESLQHAIKVLKSNNPEIVDELLQMFVDNWNTAQELLEDVVNQSCTFERVDDRNLLSDGALSAYEGAIDWLVDQGRLVRVHSPTERWVWWEEATNEEKYTVYVRPDS